MDNLLIENLSFSVVLYGFLRLKQELRCIDDDLELEITRDGSKWTRRKSDCF
jgi:hypothetical protein